MNLTFLRLSFVVPTLALVLMATTGCGGSSENTTTKRSEMEQYLIDNPEAREFSSTNIGEPAEE